VILRWQMAPVETTYVCLVPRVQISPIRAALSSTPIRTRCLSEPSSGFSLSIRFGRYATKCQYTRKRDLTEVFQQAQTSALAYRRRFVLSRFRSEAFFDHAGGVP
jgi:hypothetical protein